MASKTWEIPHIGMIGPSRKRIEFAQAAKTKKVPEVITQHVKPNSMASSSPYNGSAISGRAKSGGAVSGGAVSGGYDGAGELAIYEKLAADRQAQAENLYQQQKQALENAYSQREAARLSGFNSLQSARQAGFDRSAEQANSLADNTLQGAYVSNMMQQRNLNQQMNALGRSGGAAESTMLGLANSYGNNRGEAERTRAGNIAELNLALQQGNATDKKAYEDARANDSMWKFETGTSLENDYNKQLNAAKDSLAAQQAEVLMRQANSYKSK